MQTENVLTFAKGHPRLFFAVIVITVNTFVWYSVLYSLFPDFAASVGLSNIEEAVTIGVFFAGIACSALLGANIHIRSARLFFSLWIVIGAVSTLSLVQMSAAPPIGAFAVAFILGASIGLGLPSILAFFAEHSKIENRGAFGGLIWSATGFLTLFFAAAFNNLNADSRFLFLTIWRGLALISPIFLMSKEEKPAEAVQRYSVLLREISLAMYLLPWIMFCLVNWTEAPIVVNLFGQSFLSSLVFVQFALVGVFAFLGGLLSDIVGRKPLTIVGFILLGIEYSLVGLFSDQLVIRYVYISLDSVVWGTFAAVFFMAVWGI